MVFNFFNVLLVAYYDGFIQFFGRKESKFEYQGLQHGEFPGSKVVRSLVLCV